MNIYPYSFDWLLGLFLLPAISSIPVLLLPKSISEFAGDWLDVASKWGWWKTGPVVWLGFVSFRSRQQTRNHLLPCHDSFSSAAEEQHEVLPFCSRSGCGCSWFHPSGICIAWRSVWWWLGVDFMMPLLTTLKHGRTCVFVLHRFLVF